LHDSLLIFVFSIAGQVPRSLLFNNLDKVFDVLSGSTLCGYISKCRICTCRETRFVFGRTGKRRTLSAQKDTAGRVFHPCFDAGLFATG